MTAPGDRPTGKGPAGPGAREASRLLVALLFCVMFAIVLAVLAPVRSVALAIDRCGGCHPRPLRSESGSRVLRRQ